MRASHQPPPASQVQPDRQVSMPQTQRRGLLCIPEESLRSRLDQLARLSVRAIGIVRPSEEPAQAVLELHFRFVAERSDLADVRAPALRLISRVCFRVID